MDQKDKAKLIINKVQENFSKAYTRVPQTYSEDGTLKFGDNIMMMNKRTNGFMVMDIGDPIVSPDESYACTTTTKATPPCGRSILYLKKVNEAEGDEVVHYGE